MDAVVAAALSSAFLHAAWNAAVRAASDPRRAMTAQVVASGLALAPLLLLLPPPSPEAWPWLAASVACSLLAVLALVRGYARGGGFSVVYPLSRAISPLAVTLLARVVVGERLSPAGYAGVALVSAGVGLFAVGNGRRDSAAVGWALVGGVLTAAYTICDAQGARLSPSVAGYGATVSLVNALVLGSAHHFRLGSIRDVLAGHLGIVTLGAAAATVSYLTILWVYTRTQIAVGATLRDTSIVFAALIGVVVLGERITWMRVAAVALVAAGAGALRFA
jgi:drug/metabolite transporter (DMT)-like permease